MYPQLPSEEGSALAVFYLLLGASSTSFLSVLLLRRCLGPSQPDTLIDMKWKLTSIFSFETQEGFVIYDMKRTKAKTCNKQTISTWRRSLLSLRHSLPVLVLMVSDFCSFHWLQCHMLEVTVPLNGLAAGVQYESHRALRGGVAGSHAAPVATSWCGGCLTPFWEQCDF